VFVEDRLFATLDATTRQMVSPERVTVLVTDTVGFIRKLPHHLVASFRSTLSEVVEADLLVQVVDAADPDFRRQMQAVESVLEDLMGEPRPTLLVFNKRDALEDPDAEVALRAEFPGAHVVSARTGEGVPELREALWARAGERQREHAARENGAPRKD
jgi:GTP-binding protein HflX